MQYYKPSEILKEYDITGMTLNNWIKNAQEGKNGLKLKAIQNRNRILKTPENTLILKDLKNKSTRYKNKAFRKKYVVGNDFYKLFSTHETIDIFKTLELKSEIDLKYFYKNGGAQYCDSYYRSDYNYIKNKVNSLVFDSIEHISSITSHIKYLNIIDMGPGNAYPIKTILDSKLNSIVKSYISVDISPTINDIAIKNIADWYPKLNTVRYERDFESDRFDNIFLEHTNKAQDHSNLICFLGSSINNSDDRVSILKNFAKGMFEDDILIVTTTLDHEDNRINNSYIKNYDLLKQSEWLFNTLGIDQVNDNIEVHFDIQKSMNYKYLRLDKDYEISFKVHDQDIVVELAKDQKINFWKHYLLPVETIYEEADRAGLEIVSFTKDTSRQIGLVMYKLKG